MHHRLKLSSDTKSTHAYLYVRMRAKESFKRQSSEHDGKEISPMFSSEKSEPMGFTIFPTALLQMIPPDRFNLASIYPSNYVMDQICYSKTALSSACSSDIRQGLIPRFHIEWGNDSTDLSPSISDLYVKPCDLQDSNNKAHHTNPLQEIEQHSMRSVWEPTAIFPHLRVGIADLTNIDKKNRERHHHLHQCSQRNKIYRTELFPMTS
mmetsp:Transcript_29144/g.46971  ORF Transcript_29144/g.46971 Transcript_29144/m.46971 type:complete len:208 (-) Transcript_29144:66-689(-)